jgi:putative Ca2+/H+ antiporter (TMEM165/GDT1 family)
MMVVFRPALPEPIQPFSTTATFEMPVHLGEIVGGRQAVAAAADHDDVVFGFRSGVAPCGRPAAMAAKRLSQQIEHRIADGARSSAPIAG